MLKKSQKRNYLLNQNYLIAEEMLMYLIKNFIIIEIYHILECAKKINKKNYSEIFKIVIEIEKIKQKVVKKFNNNKQLSKIEFNEMIKKIIKNIFKNYELQNL